MYQRHETGKEGENMACQFLIQKGYRILRRNFRCKMGEIDIIAQDRNEIVFIEVKTRGQKMFGTPAEAVDKRKKRHIYKVAEYFLMRYHLEKELCRVDVIEIYLYENTNRINHIKNAISDKYQWIRYQKEGLDLEDEFETPI